MTSSLTIWVVRHGRTEANAGGLLLGRANPDLDDLGRAQAAQIASVVPNGAHVISSPLARCRQTAAAIDPDHAVDDRLIELDYGDLDLTPVADVPAETWAAWRADPHFRPPAGETLAELAGRTGTLLDELTAQVSAGSAPSSDIALVSHVSPIKAAMAWALGVGIEISWRAHVAQASITKIVVSPRGPSLHAFNEVAHLD